MRRSCLMCLAVIVSVFPGIPSAENILVQNDLDSALHFLINQNYKKASACLEKHSRKYPADNEALYLAFVTEQTRILDYESYFDGCRAFINAADSLKSVLEGRLVNLRGQDSIECLLYIANITGGISIILSKTGNWFEAMKNAVNSVSILKKVKKMDADCYEANLGIGVFNYYLNSSFKWLPFVQDKSKEGIRLVEMALNSKFPYNYAAKNSLCWILIEQGNLRRADSLAGSVLKEMPDNTVFLRIRAYISLWNGKYDAARKAAMHMLKLAEQCEPVNWSNLVTAYTIIAGSFMEQNNTREAYLAAEEFLSRRIPQEYHELPHIKKNVRQIADIRKKCQ